MLVSHELLRVLQWIIFCVLCQGVVMFGIIANIINIICFVKQGFKDTINISLLGLSVSDLGCLSTLIFTNICFTPVFQALFLSFECVEVQYLTNAWPHVVFSRITSCITAFITLERCLCITTPLKVKLVLTRQRVSIIIISLFVILVISVSPIYYACRIDWKFSPQRNRTILGLVFTPDRDIVEQVSFAVNNSLISVSTFIIIIISTVTLVINLRNKTQWREKSTSAGLSDTRNARDQKVTRIVVLISIMFIASFIPNCLIFISMIIVPELSIDGKEVSTAILLAGIGMILESLNSSMNIFVYYHMSSKYKFTFQQMFRTCYQVSWKDA